MFKSVQKFIQFSKKPIIINSSWGGVSQVLQSVLLSLVFVMIARHYSTKVFANFIIATVLYQLISAFSSLGLGQWFIREITGEADKKDLISKYFKLQIYSGVFFFFINIAFGFILYEDRQIQILTITLGLNIIFDNLINAIKCVNISEFEQKKTFIILTTDALLKFAVTCLLFIIPFSILTLSLILVIIRFITLNLFLNFGTAKLVNLKMIFYYHISINYLKSLLKLNWPFIIIGSISIINWRISTLIISKVLLIKDVADFEISFRIFSIAQMIPIVVSASVFPIMVNYFNKDMLNKLKLFYRKMHMYFFLFGFVSFTFIYSFIDYILPVVFGSNYSNTGIYTKQMFLTILVFPTAILQANLIVAMKLEKWDMWCNVLVLIINIVSCLIGLIFFKSLIVINFSIFLSFVLFHILQDAMLVKKKISSYKQVFQFYTLSLVIIGSYLLLNILISPVVLFFTYWTIIFTFFIFFNKFKRLKKSPIFLNSSDN